MTASANIATDYFAPPADLLWRWGDRGDVLIWRTGQTVAYREEIRQLLEHLAPAPAPPFESMVFLLAATRGIVPTQEDLLGTYPNLGTEGSPPESRVVDVPVRGQLKAQILASLDILKDIRNWPKGLIETFHGKKTLLDVLVEAIPAELHAHANPPGGLLNGSVRLQDLPPSSERDATNIRNRRVHTLARALSRSAPAEWLARAETSAETTPKEARELNLPWMERARRWIEHLESSEEYSTLARAARSLLAALHLPRELGRREETEVSGSADISNRGPLDRLLLSELANDDLTLTVRLALNEALYIRREPPASRPPQSLHLLLDTSLPLWGQPRFLTTAAALAFMASKQDYQSVHCWRTTIDGIVPSHLLSEAGLREHLGALESTAHPGGALAAFHAGMESLNTIQSVLLTSRDTLDDPTFLGALLQCPGTFDYYATVDRTGLFEVRTSASIRATPLCAAVLNVQELFHEQKAIPVASTGTSTESGKPAFLSIHPCPFLIPTSDRAIMTVPVVEDTPQRRPTGYRLAITAARQIVHYEPEAHGVRFLGNGLPAGRVLWMDSTRDGVHILLEGTTHHSACLVSYLTANEVRRIVELPKGPCTLDACRTRQVVLVFRRNRVLAYSLATGESMGQIQNPPPRLYGRYFRDNNVLLFLDPKSGTIGLERVVLPSGIKPDSVVTLFDRVGHSGPWMLLRDGWVAPSTSADYQSEGIAVPKAALRYLQSHRLARDGNQMEFILPGGVDRLLLPLEANATVVAHQDPNLLDSEWRSFPQTAALRNVQSFAILPNGLGLRCSGTRQYTLDLAGNGHLHLKPWHDPPTQVNWIRFSNKPTLQTTVCSLRSAALGNGSTAWLDNRGLLHLRSHDPSLPEITLLLSMFQIAAWTSDGMCCGPKGFLIEAPRSTPGQIFRLILEFRARL